MGRAVSLPTGFYPALRSKGRLTFWLRLRCCAGQASWPGNAAGRYRCLNAFPIPRAIFPVPFAVPTVTFLPAPTAPLPTEPAALTGCKVTRSTAPLPAPFAALPAPFAVPLPMSAAPLPTSRAAPAARVKDAKAKPNDTRAVVVRIVFDFMLRNTYSVRRKTLPGQRSILAPKRLFIRTGPDIREQLRNPGASKGGQGDATRGMVAGPGAGSIGIIFGFVSLEKPICAYQELRMSCSKCGQPLFLLVDRRIPTLWRFCDPAKFERFTNNSTA